MQQYYDPYGAAQQYAPQGLVGDIAGMAGGLAQQYLPFGAEPQFAPQGLLSSALGFAAGPLGGLIGRQFGHANTGRQIGRAVGSLAHFLPFGAEADFGPQGYDPAGAGMPAQYLPYGADPQFAPQGFVGNLAGAYGGSLGRMIGGHFGNANMGQQIGSLAGSLGRRFLPFEAGPEFAPQGYGGDPGGMAQQYAPYGVDPQFAPQGLLSNLISGGLRVLSNPTVRKTVPRILPHLRRFLPFEAGPDFGPQSYGGDPGGMAQQYAPYGADPQFAPQGFLGNLAGSFGGPLGRMIGGHFGNANMGQQIGSLAGNLGRRFIPFGVDPYGNQEWALA